MAGDYPPIEKLIPHRSKMLKLDRLTGFLYGDSEVEIRGEYTVKEGDIFLRDGELRESVLIEIAAQVTAAGEGYKNYLEGQPPPLGYLVGIENFQIKRAVRAGETVSCTVKLINKTGPLRVMNAELTVGDELAAQGILKLYRDDQSSK